MKKNFSSAKPFVLTEIEEVSPQNSENKHFKYGYQNYVTRRLFIDKHMER